MAKVKNERNAGRKPMYGEKSTQSKSYTIPHSKAKEFDEYARLKIAEYKAKYSPIKQPPMLNPTLTQQFHSAPHAIHNDGSLEQLREVMKTCFPLDVSIPEGNFTYYENLTLEWWRASHTTRLPIIPVTSFFAQPDEVGDTTLHVHNDIRYAAGWYNIPLAFWNPDDVYIMQEDRCVFVGKPFMAEQWIKANIGKKLPSRFPLPQPEKMVKVSDVVAGVDMKLDVISKDTSTDQHIVNRNIGSVRMIKQLKQYLNGLE